MQGAGEEIAGMNEMKNDLDHPTQVALERLLLRPHIVAAAQRTYASILLGSGSRFATIFPFFWAYNENIPLSPPPDDKSVLGARVDQSLERDTKRTNVIGLFGPRVSECAGANKQCRTVAVSRNGANWP